MFDTNFCLETIHRQIASANRQVREQARELVLLRADGAQTEDAERRLEQLESAVRRMDAHRALVERAARSLQPGGEATLVDAAVPLQGNAGGWRDGSPL
ncbi:hypothetical protein [Methylobacterium gnaphalii]|uniref:hypothetical protein n=1 Tax=Methylobacterium gnaphalii TaxID=1010610 RepID=UPI0014794A83|nr:hypothetical protein [Methylobacterium gnaphalii]